jgi:isoleucyl-tRNA synthetase
MHALGGFFARPRPFLAGDFVTTDSGTGLVHMAPDHGEDDFLLCKAHGIDPVFAVEGDGKYRADWPWLGGEGSVINPKFNAPDGPSAPRLPRSADWSRRALTIAIPTAFVAVEGQGDLPLHPQWFVPMDKSIPPVPRRRGRTRRLPRPCANAR